MVQRPPTIDMRPDGSFRQVPPRAGLPISFKLMMGAVVTLVLAGSVAVAAAAVWVLSMILPILIVAGGVVWGMLKWRRWQSLRGDRHGARSDTGTFRY